MPQLALAWVLRQPNVASAIVGASRPEQVPRTLPPRASSSSEDTLAAVDAALADDPRLTRVRGPPGASPRGTSSTRGGAQRGPTSSDWNARPTTPCTSCSTLSASPVPPARSTVPARRGRSTRRGAGEEVHREVRVDEQEAVERQRGAHPVAEVRAGREARHRRGRPHRPSSGARSRFHTRAGPSSTARRPAHLHRAAREAVPPPRSSSVKRLGGAAPRARAAPRPRRCDPLAPRPVGGGRRDLQHAQCARAADHKLLPHARANSAASSCARRPGRTMLVDIDSGANGIGRRNSNPSRATRALRRAPCARRRRRSAPPGAPPCSARGSPARARARSARTARRRRRTRSRSSPWPIWAAAPTKSAKAPGSRSGGPWPKHARGPGAARRGAARTRRLRRGLGVNPASGGSRRPGRPVKHVEVEQHVAHDQRAIRLAPVGHVAGRVPGRLEHGEAAHLVALHERARRPGARGPPRRAAAPTSASRPPPRR